MSRARAIALLSGGLDSQLAIRLMQEQDIEVTALHYESPLCTPDGGDCAAPARKAARALGVPLIVANTWDQILEVVNDPAYGHGKGVNPCVDCRIIHFRLAKRLMKERGADFIVSGEVLGQRPMSQHKRALRIIEEEAGVESLVLRPLSALKLQQTEPEKKGLVERGRLLGFQGRGRHRQMELAKELGLEEYPSPAGGCLLTERAFGVRFRRLQRYMEEKGMGPVDVRRALLLTAGRHFVSSADEWVTVARDDRENGRLMGMGAVLSAIGWAVESRGPAGGVLTVGRPAKETLVEAADLIARYGQARQERTVSVRFESPGGGWEQVVEASPKRGYGRADELERV